MPSAPETCDECYEFTDIITVDGVEVPTNCHTMTQVHYGGVHSSIANPIYTEEVCAGAGISNDAEEIELHQDELDLFGSMENVQSDLPLMCGNGAQQDTSHMSFTPEFHSTTPDLTIPLSLSETHISGNTASIRGEQDSSHLSLIPELDSEIPDLTIPLSIQLRSDSESPGSTKINISGNKLQRDHSDDEDEQPNCKKIRQEFDERFNRNTFYSDSEKDSDQEPIPNIPSPSPENIFPYIVYLPDDFDFSSHDPGRTLDYYMDQAVLRANTNLSSDFMP